MCDHGAYVHRPAGRFSRWELTGMMRLDDGASADDYDQLLNEGMSPVDSTSDGKRDDTTAENRQPTESEANCPERHTLDDPQ